MKHKGWFNHPYEHGLASKGIKTSNKNNDIDHKDYRIYYSHTTEKEHPVYSLDKNGVESRMEIWEGENFAIIYHLYVPKDKREKGIGSNIINQMEEIAEEHNVDNLFVSVGHESGDLESFMDRFGFEKSGTIDLPRATYDSQKYHKKIGDE